MLADGLYFSLPMAAYLSDPALGASSIVDLATGPLTYWARSHMNPNRIPDDDTDASAFGTILHDALLSPGHRTFATKPDGMSFATKDGKAWREDQRMAGHTILTGAQSRIMSSLKLALAESGAAKLIDGCLPEVSYFWTQNGFRCKIRIDGLKPDCAIDLKTYANTRDADAETAVAHEVARWRYHIKAYWYRLGIDHMRSFANAGGVKFHPSIDLQTGEIVAATEAQRAMVKSGAERFPFWFVFLETSGVPNVTIREFVSHDDGQLNGYWRAAKHAVEAATNDFARFMASHGAGRPWIAEAYSKPFTDEEFTAAKWILEEAE